MRKIGYLIIIALICVQSSNAQDKAFQKGKVTISIGAGLGLYGTKTHWESDSSYWDGTSVKKTTASKDKKDGAFSGIYPINVEYGVTNWLGIGGRFAYNKYVANGDSTNLHIKPTVSGMDGDLVLNLHFIKTVHFDMPLQLVAGYSGFKYKTNDGASTMAKANGINYSVSLLPRIYFGNHFGMYFNLGYAGFNYPKIVFSNNQDSNLNDDANTLFKLKAGGVNLGLGFIVKFH